MGRKRRTISRKPKRGKGVRISHNRKESAGNRKSPSDRVQVRISSDPEEHSNLACSQPDQVVVGIGASAGGLKAFTKFLEAMSDDSGLAFVLIQHLDPTHESLTAEILAKHTDMTVTEAKHNIKILPNHVYVIPPNKSLTIFDNRLILTAPAERRGLRLPIDFFFRGLAENLRNRAIGVILSGTGTDGTLGAGAIKAAGGIVIVQAPETAEYDGMPKSAMASGIVDCVAPIDKIPEVIRRYVRHWYANGSSEPMQIDLESTNSLSTIIGILRTRKKHDFSKYKKGTLARRIQRRMGLRHIPKMNEYVQLLRKEENELSALYQDLLIGVTNFFREPLAWRALEELIIAPMIQKLENGKPIRIWVAGCATGEEPYSVAMLLTERLKKADKVAAVTIFASDVDKEALSFARAGVYPESISSDISPERLRRFFLKGDHTYRISKEIRESVIFAEQNLISDPPFSKLDLICCRNVLIYLELEIQKKIMSMFHFALRNGGSLFLGNAETSGQNADLFEPVSRKWKIYRRIGPLRKDDVEVAPSIRDGPHFSHIKASDEADYRARHIAAISQQIVLQRFAPACIVANRKGAVLYLNGPVDQYLQLPSGELGADLLGMARQGLRASLRSAFQRAIRESKIITIEDARVKRDNTYYMIYITIEPLKHRKEAEGLLLVTFDEADSARQNTRVVYIEQPEQRVVERPESSAEYETLVRHLEAELATTREDLQVTIEELETSNEEFKATNEEVTSVNEELQSTNEELETSKEELQSMNEELQTINSQLEAKMGEVEATNNDLKNLLACIDHAILFLDRQFHIKRFSPATTKLLRVIHSDLGRPIRDFARNIDDPDLTTDAKSVIENLAPIEKEIRDGAGNRFLRRIVPYRTEDDRIDGVVVTFVDITMQFRAYEFVKLAIDAAPIACVLIDDAGNIVMANPATSSLFGYTRQEFIGKKIETLIPAKNKGKSLIDSALLANLHPEQALRNEGEMVGIRKDNSSLPIELGLTPVDTPRGLHVLATIVDITARKDAENKLRALNDLLEKRVVERTEQVEIYRTAFLNTQTAILILEWDGTILLWNPGAERLFGFTKKEAEGKNISIIMPPGMPSDFEHTKSELAAGSGLSELETVRTAKDGSRIDVGITASIVGGGSEGRICKIIRDIRERKRMEQTLIESLLEERRQMGIECHDALGQQITAMGMLAVAMKNDVDRKSETWKIAERLTHSAEVAKEQLRRFLNGLTRVEITAEELESALVDLANETGKTYGVNCNFNCSHGFGSESAYLATHLYWIIREAVHNAVKHAGCRNINISIRDKDGILVTVEDDGAGMGPEENRSKGMGLKIMKHRSQLINAPVEFSSAPNGGTIVSCWIR